MKIGIFKRIDAATNSGGDTVQIKAITEFLIKNKHSVYDFTYSRSDLEPVDLVIGFNLTRPYEAYLQMQIAKNNRIPFMFFPIYWNLDQVVPNKTRSLAKRFLKGALPKSVLFNLQAWIFWKNNVKLLKDLKINLINFNTFRKIINSIFLNANYVFPNSRAELNHLLLTVKHNKLKEELIRKSKIVYNGVNFDINKLPVTSIDEIKNWPYKNYVCCVGGIGPRKNQLNLVKASNESGIPLVIVGKASKGCEGYLRKAIEISKQQILWVGERSPEEVRWIIKESRGLIQPSFIETPGLAAMEAVSLNRNIAVSEVPPVKEYFENIPLYCNPYSVDSIKSCLIRLLGMEHPNFSSRFIKQYNWDMVLSPLLEEINSLSNNSDKP